MVQIQHQILFVKLNTKHYDKLKRSRQNLFIKRGNWQSFLLTERQMEYNYQLHMKIMHRDKLLVASNFGRKIS